MRRFLDQGFFGNSVREAGLGVVLNTHLGASFMSMVEH